MGEMCYKLPSYKIEVFCWGPDVFGTRVTTIFMSREKGIIILGYIGKFVTNYKMGEKILKITS